MVSSIDVLQPPDIRGLRFRTWAGEEDFPGMIDVIDAAKRVDNVERADTVATLASGYAHLTNCDPRKDVCVAEIDGRIVAYSRTWWEEQEEGQLVYLSIGFVHPDCRRQGLGRAMLRWNQHRLREVASGHPPAGRRIFRSFADEGESGAHALLEGDGYQAVTYGAAMARPLTGPLPTRDLPPGLEIRPVAPDHIRRIWESQAIASLDHWGSREQTEEDWEGFLERPYTDTNLWKVAWEGDRVVGQVRSFINDDENVEYGRLRGYTEDITTIKEWRRRGVAGALICASLRDLADRGMTEAALGVHTENLSGAFSLYQGLGFVVQNTWTIYQKPL
jgi:ribosomal protein S18 acetylase RimI-like enzyme